MSATIYQIVTDRITALLEKGVIPWQMPWTSNQQPPQNLISRKPYRGINTLLLHSMGHASPFWLTFRQAQGLGGHVKQGEKGTPVIFWHWSDVENKATGETERIPFLRYYSLFNVAQCEGIETPTTSEPVREHSAVEAAEQIVAGMSKRPEIQHGLNRAFYSPVKDTVGMPQPEQFKSPEHYYSVLFHELTHSTGHECRLNRKGVSRTEGKFAAFGSDKYAQEELVAEMGAAFLCGQAGIAERTVDNSAAYIASWLQRLKSDPKLVVQAAGQAQKASDWILGRNEETAHCE
jgi:antirestriction protein ArdC